MQDSSTQSNDIPATQVRQVVVDARADAPQPRRDLARTTFAVFSMVGLIAACFWILRAFIPALIWSSMIVVATWSLMLSVQTKLWNKRWLAVTVMTTALLLAFVIPVSLAIATLVSNADDIAAWVGSLTRAQLPKLPEWLIKLPIAGPKISAAWAEIGAAGPAGLTERLEPYARGMVAWLVLEVGSVGKLALQFLLTLVISAGLYAYGENAVAGLRHFFRKIGGARGEDVVTLAGQAIRGVAFGVVVTALVQSVMGGIGLAVADVPFTGLLTALMFVLAVAQIGAAPILFCAAGWLYWDGSTGWAIGIAVWGIVVGSMDNVLRPILIRRGGHLPLLLVLAGVIGGLISFGLIGIFVGPLVLAVSWRLVQAWVNDPQTSSDRF